MPTIQYPHIEIGSDHIPRIAGTTTKVVEIAIDHVAFGWEAPEIVDQYPCLTPAQVHAALTYYYDHRDEIDQDISRREAQAEQIRRATQDDRIRNKLREQGYLP